MKARPTMCYIRLVIVVERAGRFTRLCPQVGVAWSGCSCVLEVMLSMVLGHVGREYGCEV